MLVGWRNRAGYTDDKAELALNYPAGKIQDFEIKGITKVPLCEIGRIVKLYEGSETELMEIVLLETAKIRPELFFFWDISL